MYSLCWKVKKKKKFGIYNSICVGYYVMDVILSQYYGLSLNEGTTFYIKKKKFVFMEGEKMFKETQAYHNSQHRYILLFTPVFYTMSLRSCKNIFYLKIIFYEN